MVVEKDKPMEENEPISARYNLRPHQEQTYNQRFAHIMDNPASSKSYNAQFQQQGANINHQASCHPYEKPWKK
jgi:hypothetical protein